MVEEKTAQLRQDSDDEVRRGALACELCVLICTGSLDELRAFGVIARRVMGKGREIYGPLDLRRDRRDFRKERADEKADWIWYDAILEVIENDERLERLRCEAADRVAAAVEPGLRELAEALPPPPDSMQQRLEEMARKLDAERAHNAALRREVARQRRAFDVSDEETQP